MNTSTGERVFLATTALEEFWDLSLPIVFLGPWCLRYSRREVWKPLQHGLLESPWETIETRMAALEVCNSQYEQLLGNLRITLNRLHGVSESPRYWRILLGPWLQCYVAAAYDRFTCIMSAMQRYPNLTTICLSPNAHVIPVDTAEFDALMMTDGYNLQLYTRVLQFAKKQLPAKSYVLRRPVASPPAASLVQRVEKALLDLFNRVSGGRDSVLMHRSYFQWSAELGLLFLSRGRVRRITVDEYRPVPLPVDTDARNTIRESLRDARGFASFLRFSVPLDLPQSFVEGYSSLRQFADANYPPAPKAIFTANAEYYDEPFKYWAASAAEKGSLFLGTVHGTRYGAAAWMRAEDHEVAILDRYYSWGWERSDCRAKVIPMPASKLAGGRPIGVSNARKGILFATTTAPRYLREFPFTPQQFAEYLDWQKRFLAGLVAETRRQVRYRPHRADQGWDIVGRLVDAVPSLQIENWDVPFTDSLRNCALYVCDHCSTTFGEALAADKPTILFWKYEGNELRESAKPFFDDLCRSGILFHDPEKAANAVNAAISDVAGWWNTPIRQEARKRFCDRFARTSGQPVREWATEFRQIRRTAALPQSSPSALDSPDAKSARC